MNIITKLATKMLAVLSVVAMIASPAAAQGLSASDMAFAFGGQAAPPAAAHQTARAATPKAAEPVAIASARDMTQTEMQETEGAIFWAPVYGAVVLGTRATMWAAPRLAPNTFRTVTNSRNAHTLMFNRSTGRHVCHVACGTGTGINGAHVGWGAGGRAGHNAANHIYRNSPWRINPW